MISKRDCCNQDGLSIPRYLCRFKRFIHPMRGIKIIKTEALTARGIGLNVNSFNT